MECIRFPSTPVYEVICGPPPSEASTSPFTTSRPVAAELSAPPIPDHLPPPSPRTVPPRTTPTTPAPIACVTSPVPHLCSCLSFSASHRRQLHVLQVLHSAVHVLDRRHPRRPRPLDARPLHGIYARKTSMSSPLAPCSRPASPGLTTGPGAPPLSRQTGRTAASDVGGSARKSWCYLLLPLQISYSKRMRAKQAR